MEIKAKLKYIKTSPRKFRLVLNSIKGMSAHEALRELPFIPKRAAGPVAKLLKSAIANAEHNYNLKKDELVVKVATADQGPTIKRSFPRAFGKTDPIRKRSAHITIVLESKKGAGK